MLDGLDEPTPVLLSRRASSDLTMAGLVVLTFAGPAATAPLSWLIGLEVVVFGSEALVARRGGGSGGDCRGGGGGLRGRVPPGMMDRGGGIGFISGSGEGSRFGLEWIS